MGAGGSKSAAQASISDPFPINMRLSKDLDKLSFVAARILSTPDIYDINNLARPGICGDYAVFLKKGLEKKLLPFISDISGTLQEVVYQNPRKAISDLEVRKKICSQMVETMLRAIATVVACLASIQVASQSRETAVSTVPKQTGGTQIGGSVTGVRDWFLQAGYISAIDAAKPSGSPMIFQVPGIPASPKFQFKLTLERTEGNLTYGLISADSKEGIQDPLPSGSLRVQFLNQVTLPIPGSTKTVLPMRIVDNAGLPWAAGIFYESVFKSFVDKTGQYYITDFFERLFRRTQGAVDAMVESREQIAQANDVFQQFRRTQNPQIVLQSLGKWFAEHIPGFQAGYQAPPYGLPQVPYGLPQVPQYGLPYGQPYAQPIQPIRPVSYGVGAIPGTVSLRPTTGDVSFDIPLNATKGIQDTFKLFRDLIPKQSSPAAVRANTLAALENRDRTVQTAVCRDPYWFEPNLSKIYPWATLQFLSISNWKDLADDRSKIKPEKEWTDFLDELGKIYSSAPKLERAVGANFLDQMRFSKVNELSLCKTSQNPRVRFKEVQDGILALQGIHERHVAKMWSILNDLIFVIEDPDTRTEMVRLHPNVVSSTSKLSSESYVKNKAKEAREAIAHFYLDVERTYMKSIQELQVVG